jgi:hypothetical protein
MTNQQRTKDYFRQKGFKVCGQEAQDGKEYDGTYEWNNVNK